MPIGALPVAIRLARTLKTDDVELAEMAIHGTHILIVDDYPDALDIWAMYLTSLGYHVSTAADGATAIAQAEQLRPDLIVLDLELPGVSGLEAARRLRSNPDTHHIPLIAATGYSHERQLSMARDVFDRVVVKPIDPDALVEEIERLLESSAVPVRQPIRNGGELAQGNG
jgi:two-component system, sensor histidine kinase